MKKITLSLVLLLLLGACAAPMMHSAPANAEPVASLAGLQISSPMAMAANTGDVTGVFLAIKNTGAEADRLLSAKSDAAEVVQVHETTMKDGIMSMQEVPGIDLPAGETVLLKHGGYHIMLINLKQDLTPGTTLTIILQFEKAGELSLSVPVMSK